MFHRSRLGILAAGAVDWKMNMKVRLGIHKDGERLFERTYNVAGAEDFGAACADAWQRLRTKELERTTSVGEMMDMLDTSVLDVLDGAVISLSRA
jgi:hypothetical protein